MRAKLVAIGLAIAVSLTAGIAFVSQLLISRFDKIELAETRERVAQIVRAFEADLDQLAICTRDYAEWDDAHAYAIGRKKDFLAANFSRDSLRGMDVDAVIIFAADGSVMYSGLLSENGTDLISPAPMELLHAFGTLRSAEPRLRQLPSSRRIIRTPRGLIAFSAVEIRRSHKSSATSSVMFFARILRADDIARVGQVSRLPAQLTLIDATTANLATLDARVTGTDSVVGYALVNDVAGRPIAYFSTRQPRDLGRLGRRTTWQVMGALTGLIALSAAALLAMMLRLRQSWTDRLAMESRHRNILTQLDESVALADPVSGRIIDANEALLRTLGYTRADLPTLNLRGIYVDLPATLQAGMPTLERRLRARDGSLREEEVTISQVIEGQCRLVCIVGRDISQRRQAEQALRENQHRLAHLIEHDPLTELPNRTFLDARLPQLLKHVHAEEQSLALLCIDIDRFKNVNDAEGHALADAVLKVLARRLSAAISAHDILLRSGGDEFVILAPGVTGGRASRALAERLLSKIREPIVLDDARVCLTASLGISIYPDDGSDGETLLKHADTALQAAKEHGRDCFREFSKEMNVQLSEHLTLARALRRALVDDEIYVEYQPVVDLRSGLLVSFESLARWRSPALGVISPGRFIPVAEKNGLIVAMTEQIVRKVLQQLAEWQRAGLLLAPVAINVAPVQFQRTEFAAYVQQTALDHGVDPRWLSFEVTETAWMHNTNKNIVMIDSLRHEGSRIYIDDFGTGFSNLSYLKSLPVDAVKIDQSFVRGIETDPSDEAIVVGIITMARQLNLATVAEGIETAGQAQKLRTLGCLYGQGYYFSRPVPADTCRVLLEELSKARQVTETLTTRASKKATN